MRIGAVADLAGVTIRTVRHYHRLGVLPEPPRRSNGYRDYTVDHLVALLRIRELTASGLSLAQAGAVVADLDANPASAEEALDEIDRALAARIDALTDQRRRLAEARSGRHVGLSRLAAALTVKPTDVPGATLLAHLYAGVPQAEALADRLLTPDLRRDLETMQKQFDTIDETTSGADLDTLATEVQRIVDELVPHLPPLSDDKSELVLALTERDMNDRQREFIRRLT